MEKSRRGEEEEKCEERCRGGVERKECVNLLILV